MDNENLYNDIANLSTKSGIYQYFDKNNRLLYVGKAKNLKKRIKTYFTNDLNANAKNSLRIQKMTSQIARISTIIVEDEQEALILENSFIKSQNPKYNILLRDDKTYPYIYINLNDSYPRFEITRNIKSIKSKILKNSQAKEKNIIFFGPYTKGATKLLKSLYEIFPLVQAKNCIKNKKLCLYYEIKQCLGGCVKDVQNEYQNIIKQAISALKNTNKMIKILQDKMAFFQKRELFERALIYRDNIEILQEIKPFSIVDMRDLSDRNILSFQTKNHNAIIFKIFIRSGRVISTDHIFFKSSIDGAFEAYKRSIFQMMKDDMPKDIIIANITNEDFLNLKNEFGAMKINLILPKNENVKKLAEMANINALKYLESKMQSAKNDDDILQDIARLFLFDSEISSVEIFDTSHHGGSFCTGAMVSYEFGSFTKENFRHYNLTSTDEASQMREMLQKRIKSFDKLAPPSLWLLDGGMAQINIALELLELANVNVEVIAIAKEKRDAKAYRAKGAAKDILRSKNLEFKLDVRDKRLLLMQKMRDEAHRFAISFHRNKKTKSMNLAK